MIKPIFCVILTTLLLLPSTLPGLAKAVSTDLRQNPGESAVITSLEAHKWQQLDSMGGTFHGFCDIAPEAGSSSLLAVTYNNSTSEAVWRGSGSPVGSLWTRVVFIDTTSNNVILRLSPGYSGDRTMYLAEAGSTRIGVSSNSGQTWLWHDTPGPIVDIAIRDKNTVYIAMSNSYIAKSTDAAVKWPHLMATGIFDINMLAVSDNQTIFIGGRSGNVAYSTNDGASYTYIPTDLGSDNVLIATDTNFAENSTIYAGNGNRIYRRVLNGSSDWEIMRTLNTNQQVSGLAIADGVLYSAWYRTAGIGSGVERYLEPTKPIVFLEYDSLTVGAEAAVFDDTPNSLRVSSTNTGARLYAIDTAGPSLMVYDDTLSHTAPTLVSPANGTNLTIGTRTTFKISTIPNATTYKIQYSPDSTFKTEVSSRTITVPATQTTLQTLNEGIYWRARATIPIMSPWSEIWAIGAQPISTANVPTLNTPGTLEGSTVDVSTSPTFKWSVLNYATGYELQLARDANMTKLVADMTEDKALGNVASWKHPDTLDYGTTYYWRVRAIISIGADYSDWSDVISFTTITKASSAEPAPPATTPPAPPSSPAPLPAPPPLPVPVTLNYLWVIAGIAAILGIVLIFMKVRKPTPKVASPSRFRRPATKVSGSLLSTPPLRSPRASKYTPSPTPKPTVVPAATSMAITAEKLYDAYKAERTTADTKFTNKILKVTGAVGLIVTKDVLGTPSILLSRSGTEEPFGVQCIFQKKYEPELALLKKGQTVTVQGRCDGYIANVIMKDCVFVR